MRLTPYKALPTIAPPKTRTTQVQVNHVGGILGAIAQLGERYNGIVEVGSSILPGSTKSSSGRQIQGAAFAATRIRSRSSQD